LAPHWGRLSKATAVSGNVDRMEIILIVAMAANRVIGRGNDIPWHIPGEQRRFKAITMGHTLVMGRLTYQSIGRPLPGRKTVIVTRQQNFRATGCVVVHSLDEALAACAGEEKVFIAGGGELFRQTMPLVDVIYLTTLHREVAGDILFPVFSEEEFVMESEQVVVNEEEPYTFAVYRRRQP